MLVGVLLLGAAGCVAEYGEVLRDEGRKPAPPRRSRIDNPAPVPVKGTDDWASLPGASHVPR